LTKLGPEDAGQRESRTTSTLDLGISSDEEHSSLIPSRIRADHADLAHAFLCSSRANTRSVSSSASIGDCLFERSRVCEANQGTRYGRIGNFCAFERVNGFCGSVGHSKLPRLYVSQEKVDICQRRACRQALFGMQVRNRTLERNLDVHIRGAAMFSNDE